MVVEERVVVWQAFRREPQVLGRNGRVLSRTPPMAAN
jgi:hypothetical protein